MPFLGQKMSSGKKKKKNKERSQRGGTGWAGGLKGKGRLI